ncbi:MAG TPA: alpha/beta hydrolase [Mycobacteriales bacterium]|nr:alpha/beta hydrolase [Mycobacteriales bacterium]
MTVLPDTCAQSTAPLACVTRGEGDPVTLLVHGVAGSAVDTRPYATALAGTAVHAELRGHGGSPELPPEGWDYELLARDIAETADAYGAHRALGISLGAGVLLHLAAHEPARFRSLVLVMPASVDRPRTDAAAERLAALEPAVLAGDVETLRDAFLAELPPEVAAHRGARLAAHRKAALLAARRPPKPVSRDLVPVPDRTALLAVRCPVLVLAHEHDPLHPVEVAEDVASALPHSELVVLPAGGLGWALDPAVPARVAAALA